MNCDERRDLLLLYAADALDAGEREDLRAHLATGCPTCEGALAEAVASLAQLPLALPAHSPPARARERLMKRVDDDARQDAPPLKLPSPPRRSWLAPAALAACIGAIVTAAVLWLPAQQKQREAADQLARLTADRQAMLARETAMNDRIRVLEARDVQTVMLAGSDPQPAARGRIFWDKDHGKWEVFVFDMNPPGAGKTYELWFINADQKKIAAGTFDVDAQGRGSLSVNVPSDAGQLKLAAITDEPTGGLPQPSGKVQLVGKLE